MQVINEPMPHGLASLQIGDQLFINEQTYNKEADNMNNFNDELNHLYRSDRNLFAVSQELEQLVTWVNEAVNQGRLKDNQVDNITTLARSIQINLNGSRRDIQNTYYGLKDKTIPLIGETN